VLKQGTHAGTAADFLSFMTNPTNSAKLAQYFPPARQSQLNAETLAKTNPLLKPDQLQKVVVDGISKGVVKPSHTGQAELSQQVRASLDPLWKPDANVKSVLDGPKTIGAVREFIRMGEIGDETPITNCKDGSVVLVRDFPELHIAHEREDSQPVRTSIRMNRQKRSRYLAETLMEERRARESAEHMLEKLEAKLGEITRAASL
jgi:hypothetical protein